MSSKIKYAIYNSSGNFEDETAETTTTTDAVWRWYDASYSTALSLTAQDIALAFLIEYVSGQTTQLRYDSGANNWSHNNNTYADGFPSTRGSWAATQIMSIYATYTEPVGTTVGIKIGGTFTEKPLKVKKAGAFEDAAGLTVQ